MKSNVVKLDIYKNNEDSEAIEHHFEIYTSQEFRDLFNVSSQKLSEVNKNISLFYRSINFRNTPYFFKLNYDIYGNINVEKVYDDKAFNETVMNDEYFCIEGKFRTGTRIYKLYSCNKLSFVTIHEVFNNINLNIDKIMEHQIKIHNNYMATIGNYEI